MRIVVLGANGGVGRRAVQAAAAAGHEVVAAARTAPSPPGDGVSESGPQRVLPLAVDVRDAVAVRLAVEEAEAVLWCVGVTKRSGPGVGRQGLENLVAAARETGLRRVVSVSGAGITLPGDVKGTGARLLSGLTQRLARDLYDDKVAEHAVLAASTLDWTEVRGPRLVDRDGTGRWRLTEVAPGLVAKPVPKADVAAAMLSLAVSPDWVRRSPFLVAA